MTKSHLGADETIRKLTSYRHSIAEQLNTTKLFLSYKFDEQQECYENVTKIADIYWKFFVMSSYLHVPVSRHQVSLLDVPRLSIWTKEERKERRREAVHEYLGLFKRVEQVLGEQPVPFGERECGFVPEEVQQLFRGNTPVSRLIGKQTDEVSVLDNPKTKRRDEQSEERPKVRSKRPKKRRRGLIDGQHRRDRERLQSIRRRKEFKGMPTYLSENWGKKERQPVFSTAKVII